MSIVKVFIEIVGGLFFVIFVKREILLGIGVCVRMCNIIEFCFGI